MSGEHGRRVVWTVASPCCGRRLTHIYPAACPAIECDCGQWIATPTPDLIARRIPEQATGAA